MRKIVGVSVGGTKSAICYASLGEHNEILSIDKKVVKTYPKDPYKTINLIFEELDKIPKDFDYISVITGSPMDAKNGIVKSPSNLPGWIDFPSCKLLKDRYKVNSSLLNDADASALAEYYYGVGKNSGFKNFIYLTVGTGFGSGIIINGELYTGGCFNAGEIGYVKCNDSGYMPRNKQPGTFEGFVSGGGMGDFANLYIKDFPNSSLNEIEKGEITAKDVFQHAKLGDEFALQIVNQCAARLGEAVSVYLNLLNPDAIAIGGIYPRGISLLEKPLMESVKQHSLAQNVDHVKIMPSLLEEKIDDYSSLMGIYKQYE